MKKIPKEDEKRIKFSKVIEKMAKRGTVIKHQSLSGLYASRKNNSMIWFESNLEKDFATCLEFHNMVNCYEEQPTVVEYYKEGNLRSYTPDFLVHFNESTNMKPWLCEVKFREDLRDNFLKYKSKFKAAIDLCSVEGWEFKLVTEDYIRTPFLENAQFLLRYKFDYVDNACYTQTLTTVSELRVTTPEEVMLVLQDNHFNIRGYCLYALWYGIRIGEINCDLTKKLTMQTEIWLRTVYHPNGNSYE